MAANTEGMVVGLELDVQIIGAEGLAVKDKALFGRGSSDPYVSLTHGKKTIHKTKTIEKNLNPVWNEACKIVVADKRRNEPLVFSIFDWDRASEHDPMGEVTIPLTEMKDIDGWFPVRPCAGTTNVSGKLHVAIKFHVKRSINLSSQQSMPISGGVLAAGLGWELGAQGQPVDLDLSVVGMSSNGQVLMDETVYFADLSNSNGSIKHSGDEKEGDENLYGTGDDETVIIDLDRVPHNVLCLYVIATVASPKYTFADIRNCYLRLVGVAYGMELCRYYPAQVGSATALLMCRLAREKTGGWKLNVVGTTDNSARDFGSLIPELKTLTYDLVPSIKVDPKERVCLLRKGGVVRLRDYCGVDGIPKKLTLGLAWDITKGKNVDLDASAIMLTSSLTVFDQVYFRNLRSKDGSIQHCGDEREGDSKGDDEKINIDLGAVDKSCAYIGFTVNSFSGIELDDVRKCACHVFDPTTNRDLCKYKLSKDKTLDGKTALLISVLYRDPGTGEWVMQIISEGAQGRTCNDLVDELQAYLKTFRPTPLGPPRAQALVAQWANGQGGDKPTILVKVPPGAAPGMQLVVNGPKGPLWCTVPAGSAVGQDFPVFI